MATGRALPSSLKYFVFSLIAALMIREKVEKQLLYGPAHLGKNEEGQERLAALIPLKMSLSLRTRAGCGKMYLSFRILYTAKDTRTLQLSRIVLGGDVHTNPGPSSKRMPKNPCKECEKTVRSNQEALLCVHCNTWSHVKCIGLRKAEFKSYKVCPEIQWTCSLCLLLFSQEECLKNCLQEEFISINNSVEEDDYANNNAGEAVYACLRSGPCQRPTRPSRQLLSG